MSKIIRPIYNVVFDEWQLAFQLVNDFVGHATCCTPAGQKKQQLIVVVVVVVEPLWPSIELIEADKLVAACYPAICLSLRRV